MSVYAPIGVLFIHIPKTGGSSVVEWMLRNIPHTTHHRMVHPRADTLLTQHPNSDVIFTAVRNPWARVVSFYTYLKQRVNSGVVSFDEQPTDYTFEQFVGLLDRDISETTYTVNGESYSYWFRLSTPQTEWISGADPYILKTETLAEDFKIIQSLLGCNVPLSHSRKSNSIPYQQFYSTETKKLVQKYFEEDIDAFKYTFE